jgi:hypothetical protein
LEYSFGLEASNSQKAGTMVRPFKVVFINQCNGTEELKLRDKNLRYSINVDEVPTTTIEVDKQFINSKT